MFCPIGVLSHAAEYYITRGGSKSRKIRLFYRKLQLPFRAAGAALYLISAIFTAVSRAISIIWVKEVWRSSAERYCCL